jgi:hypothetical protein
MHDDKEMLLLSLQPPLVVLDYVSYRLNEFQDCVSDLLYTIRAAARYG